MGVNSHVQIPKGHFKSLFPFEQRDGNCVYYLDLQRYADLHAEKIRCVE